MSVLYEPLETREASTRSLVAVVALMIGSALGFTLLTAPVTKLLGANAGAIPSAFHGLAAFLYLFVGTIGLYLGWRLLTGRISAFADLQLLAVVMATMSFLAIVFGNWLYIAHPIHTMAAPLWSVSMEEQFYLFWPWAVRSGSRARVFYRLVLGQPNAAGDNAILLPSHYMANFNGYNWLIGPRDRAFDPANDFLILTELFGNGRSSSPSVVQSGCAYP